MRTSMLLIVLAGLIAGCGRAPSKTETETAGKEGGRPFVYVVNYPLKYFAERIAGDLVDVRFPAPKDEDPAYWSPDAETVAGYQEADMILLNGADYAKWASKVSLPSAKMVDTGKAVTEQFIELEEHVTHSHGPGGKHEHGGVAFTTWLDPALAVEQARAVKDALAKRLPHREDVLERRFAALEQELRAIDGQIESVVSKDPKQPLVFSHPVYQYFERRYGLNGKSVHWEPGEAPDEKMWQELKKMLGTHPARWMIWEGDPMPATVAKLKNIGLQSVVFNPCGNVPDEGDYLSVMRGNARRLGKVFEKGD